MSIYHIGTYDIHDPTAFAAYPPKVAELLPKYGGRLLAADTQPRVVEGTARTMNALIEFPTFQAALGLYNDPVYQPLKRLRHASTSNITMLLVAGVP